MIRIAVMLLTLTIAACASTPQRPVAEVEADVQRILSEPLPDSEYADSKRCLSVNRYDDVEVLDQRRVLFYGRGDDVWLNQLRQPCIGLWDDATLAFELRQSELCSLDTFHGVDRMLFRWQRTSGACVLGEFERITPAQAAQLEDVYAHR